ncbi:hypothetical protein P0L94_15455 [Microbacter sp. GSS18]|nr:hypothetical protein P0L94_15455 [Microbacter sp. GSS18]
MSAGILLKHIGARALEAVFSVAEAAALVLSAAIMVVLVVASYVVLLTKSVAESGPHHRRIDAGHGRSLGGA